MPLSPIKQAIKNLRPVLYLSAGSWGALLNVLTALVLIGTWQFSIYEAFFAGLIVNAIFNFWFCLTYHLGASRDRWPEFSLVSALIIHLVLLLIGVILLWLLTEKMATPVVPSLCLTVLALSLLSLFIGRIWIFVSPFASNVEYEALDGEFYEDSESADKVGWFRAWYHGGRFQETLKLVKSMHKPGGVIYDFGSGGSQWNSESLPVTGIDVNENLLKHGVTAGQLKNYARALLWDTGLPAASADVVVITEVLEHMEQEHAVLKEIGRVLKPDGTLVVTVPWDRAYTPFFWLFNAQCLYRGYVLGEEYYRQRCGHVHHFSAGKLRGLLRKHGFETQVLYRFRFLLLYTAAKFHPGGRA